MVVVLALSGLFLWPGFEATVATSGTVSEPSDEVTSSLLRCLKIRSWFSLRSLWSVVKCVQVSCDTNNFFDCAASSKEPWPWREPLRSIVWSLSNSWSFPIRAGSFKTAQFWFCSITLLYASLLLFVQRIGMLALFNRGIKTLDLSFGSSLFRRYGEALNACWSSASNSLYTMSPFALFITKKVKVEYNYFLVHLANYGLQ